MFKKLLRLYAARKNIKTAPSTADTAAIQALLAELRLIEKRLGTDAEQPDDCDRCRTIAHKLNTHRLLESLALEICASGAADKGLPPQ